MLRLLLRRRHRHALLGELRELALHASAFALELLHDHLLSCNRFAAPSVRQAREYRHLERSYRPSRNPPTLRIGQTFDDRGCTALAVGGRDEGGWVDL